MTNQKQIFSDATITNFEKLYPACPSALAHELYSHPLFSRAALASLADRLPARNVEHSLGNVSVSQDPSLTQIAPLTPGEVVRSIDENGCWMVLKQVEIDPHYRAMMNECLSGLTRYIQTKTGPIFRQEAFIFISAPGAVTPFHMDPEHNILMQISGKKIMHVYPADDQDIVPQVAHEAFHRGAHRNLHHAPAFDEGMIAFPMQMGDAVYVPVKAPHWVQNGSAPSISFSITWRSQSSDGAARLHRVNHRLRQLGLNPQYPGQNNAADTIKIVAHKSVKKTTATIRRLWIGM